MNFKLKMYTAFILAMIFSASAMAEVTTVAVDPPGLGAFVEKIQLWVFTAVKVVLLIFGGGCLLLIVLLIKRALPKRDDFAGMFERRDYLMSPAELRFYKQLRIAADKHFWVHAQVRVEDVIEARKETKERSRVREYVKSSHFDFVVTTNESKIVCAIELDDSSHDRPDRQRADKIKNELAAAVGLKLLRFESGRDYSPDVIASQIAEN